jgi:hypothetical protein
MAGEIRWDHSAGAEWKIHERISHPLDCSHEFQGLLAHEYLTDVLARVRDATSDEQLDALLPDRWEPPGPAP